MINPATYKDKYTRQEQSDDRQIETNQSGSSYFEQPIGSEDSYDYEKEANRRVLSRWPTEFRRTLGYNLPDDQTIDALKKQPSKTGMPWQSAYSDLLFSESQRIARGMIIGLPAALVRGTIGALYTPFAMLSQGVVGDKGLPKSFDIPALGKVSTIMSYMEDAEKLGFSKGSLMSSVYGFSAAALDATMIYPTAEIASMPFRPRVGALSREIMSKDHRPLVNIETKLKQTKVPSSNKLPTQTVEPTSVITKGQNPKITYQPVSPEVSAKFGGGDVRIKITPKANGGASYQVVKIKPSLFEKAKSFFGKLKGQSSGKFGQEIILKTGDYVPPSGISFTPAAGALAIDKTGSRVYNESAGKGSAIGSAPYRGITVDNYDTMQSHFGASEFSDFGKAINETAGKYGIKIISESNASGAWKDTDLNKIVFEPSKRIILENNDKVDVFAADIGKQKGQQSVYRANFEADNPLGYEYGIQFKDKQAAFDFIKTIEESGIEGVSFDDSNNIVYIGDADNTLENNIANFYDRANQQGLTAGISRKPAEINFIGEGEFDSILSGSQNNQGKGNSPAIQTENGAINTGRSGNVRSKISVPQSMNKPVRGFEDEPIDSEQIEQLNYAKEKSSIDDDSFNIMMEALTDKKNVNDLTQQEAYELQQSILTDEYSGEDSFGYTFSPWLRQTRNLFDEVEQMSGGKLPLYSNVYLPMTLAKKNIAGDLHKILTDSRAKDYYGKYAGSKFYREREMISDYLEGKTTSIIDNKTLSEQTKKDLIAIAEKDKKYFADFHNELRKNNPLINFSRFYEEYLPSIRKTGGYKNLQTADSLPPELRAFYEMEREGMFDVRERDSLALHDIYAAAYLRQKYVKPVYDEAVKIINSIQDENLKIHADRWLKEVMGYSDKTDTILASGLKKIADAFGGKMKTQDARIAVKNFVEGVLTTSYTAALGLPRISPLFNNPISGLLNIYAEYGADITAAAISDHMTLGMQPAIDKGLIVNLGGMEYGSELSNVNMRQGINGIINQYLQFSRATMKPYGKTEDWLRSIGMYAARRRFMSAYDDFSSGKISQADFEKKANLDGKGPSLANFIRGKIYNNNATPEDIEMAIDAAVGDDIDRTLFPYRKGEEGRIFWGTGGKLAGQFLQYPAEFANMLHKYAVRGQWDKLLRLFGMGAAINKYTKEQFGIDISRYILLGPFSGTVLSPTTKASLSAVEGMNSALEGNDNVFNKSWDKITETLLLYGGPVVGVGAKKLLGFYKSINGFLVNETNDYDFEDFNKKVKENNLKIDVSSFMKSYREPLIKRIYDRLNLLDKVKYAQIVAPRIIKQVQENKFPIYSSQGKLIRYANFADLLKYTLGFQPQSWSEESKIIKNMLRTNEERSIKNIEAGKELINDASLIENLIK